MEYFYIFAILVFLTEGVLIATKTIENTVFSASMNCFLIAIAIFVANV